MSISETSTENCDSSQGFGAKRKLSSTGLDVARKAQRNRHTSTTNEKDTRPALKSWTRWEDEILIGQLNELGGYQWEAIAAHLPGRTDHAVRNRYHKLRRAKRRQEGEEPPITSGYKCGKCGQNKKGHICSVASDDETGEVPSYCLALPNVTARSNMPAKRTSRSPLKKELKQEDATLCAVPLVDDESMISGGDISEHRQTYTSDEYDSVQVTAAKPSRGESILVDKNGSLTGLEVAKLLDEFDVSLESLEDLIGSLDSDHEADEMPVVPVPPPLKRDMSSAGVLKSFNNGTWRAREIDNLIDTYY